MYNKTSNPQARKWLLSAMDLQSGQVMAICCRDKKDQNRIYFLLASERRMMYDNDSYGVFKEIQFRFVRTAAKGSLGNALMVKVSKIDLDRKVEIE